MNEKRKQLDQSFSLGSWLSSGSPLIAEIAAQYPFNWLLIDFEHGHAGESCLPEILRAIGRVDAAVIVRVPCMDAAAIARYLDWGADGIMLPRVHTAEEARACVAAMRYPPNGNRGYSSSARAYGFGKNAPPDPRQVQPLLFVQIEDAKGVSESEAIAAVDGVDVLFVGPSDLRMDLAMTQGQTKLTFDEALLQVYHAASTHRKHAGILVRDHQQVESMKSVGYNCIAVDSDVAILRNGYERIVKLKDQP